MTLSKSLYEHKILVVGCGQIGSAIARNLVSKGLIPYQNLFLFDCKIESLRSLSQELGAEAFTTANDTMLEADILLVAVKPQDFLALSEQIKKFIKSSALVISVMAGIKIDSISKNLENLNVVRSMPNLNIRLSRSMTSYVCSEQLTQQQKSMAQELLCSFGKALELKHEELLDPATAIAGSGPAYLFYLAELLIDSANKLGFDATDSEFLVKETLAASAELLLNSSNSAKHLKESVRSKGGTTNAALTVLEESEFSSLFERAVSAASLRAKELSS